MISLHFRFSRFAVFYQLELFFFVNIPRGLYFAFSKLFHAIESLSGTIIYIHFFTISNTHKNMRRLLQKQKENYVFLC